MALYLSLIFIFWGMPLIVILAVNRKEGKALDNLENKWYMLDKVTDTTN